MLEVGSQDLPIQYQTRPAALEVPMTVEHRQAAKAQLVAAMQAGQPWQCAVQAAGLTISRSTAYSRHPRAGRPAAPPPPPPPRPAPPRVATSPPRPPPAPVAHAAFLGRRRFAPPLVLARLSRGPPPLGAQSAARLGLPPHRAL